MYICPNCNKTSDTPVNFCSECGTPMVEQAPAQPQYQQPAYEQPAYQQPVYQQPQPMYQYTQTVTAEPSKGKVITGMALGIAGLSMAVLGLLYTLMFMAMEPEVGFGFGFVFSIISAPLSIVGMVISNGCINAGSTSAMSSIGKKLGLVGLILSGVMLFFAFISLGIS